MAKTKHWTSYRLTDSMLRAMSSMHNRQRHKYGTMLDALERRADGSLIRRREPRCPECGDKRIAGIDANRLHEWNSPGDKLECANCGQINRRHRWGGCYGFTYELTEAGRQALAAARRDGW